MTFSNPMNKSLQFTLGLLLSSLAIFSQPQQAEAQGPQCRTLFLEVAARPELPRHQLMAITESLKRRGPGTRMIQWAGSPLVPKGTRDFADPERPLKVTLPNGQTKLVITESGQNYAIVNKFEDLVNGGPIPVRKMRLFNEHGIPYGEDGRDYAMGSGTWDGALFINERGEMFIFAGTMESDPVTKRPFTIEKNNTRRRKVFKARWVKDEQSPEGYSLEGYDPKEIWPNYKTPTNGEWLTEIKTPQGKTEVTFRHGYGGLPTTFPDGTPYRNSRGNYEMYHEGVIEERNNLPFRTAIFRTEINPDTMQAVGPSVTVLDVHNPKTGKPYPATERHFGGQLVEGPHIDILDQNYKPVLSQTRLDQMRARNEKIILRMSFSSGDFYRYYGGNLAYAHGEHGRFSTLENPNGDLYDVLDPMRRLITWGGRPVYFYNPEGTQMYMAFHGVPRAAIPEGLPLDVHPGDNFVLYNQRASFITPVEETTVVSNGQPIRAIRIKDPKLMNEIEKYALPPKPQ